MGNDDYSRNKSGTGSSGLHFAMMKGQEVTQLVRDVQKAVQHELKDLKKEIKDIQNKVHDIDKSIVEIDGKFNSLYDDVEKLSNLTQDSGRDSIVARLLLIEEHAKQKEKHNELLKSNDAKDNIEKFKITKELILGIIVAVSGLITGILGHLN